VELHPAARLLLWLLEAEPARAEQFITQLEEFERAQGTDLKRRNVPERVRRRWRQSSSDCNRALRRFAISIEQSGASGSSRHRRQPRASAGRTRSPAGESSSGRGGGDPPDGESDDEPPSTGGRRCKSCRQPCKPTERTCGRCRKQRSRKRQKRAERDAEPFQPPALDEFAEESLLRVESQRLELIAVMQDPPAGGRVLGRHVMVVA
jgi:hypothetical protein